MTLGVLFGLVGVTDGLGEGVGAITEGFGAIVGVGMGVGITWGTVGMVGVGVTTGLGIEGCVIEG